MQWLAKLLVGTALSPILDTVLKWRQQELEAAGSEQARKVELARQAMTLDQREAELNNQLLIAEQGNWVTRWVRPVWALPFVLFTWKVIVWDKLLGWGTTDPLDPKMWGVFMLMVGAYFGGRSLEKVATTVAGVFKK